MEGVFYFVTLQILGAMEIRLEAERGGAFLHYKAGYTLVQLSTFLWRLRSTVSFVAATYFEQQIA